MFFYLFLKKNTFLYLFIEYKYISLGIITNQLKPTIMKKIFTKKTGAGHYTVEFSKDYEVIGSFTTTDMLLISDIDELNSDGFEDELNMFDTFEEVIDYVESKI